MATFDLGRQIRHETAWTTFLTTNYSLAHSTVSSAEGPKVKDSFLNDPRPSVNTCCKKVNGGEWGYFEDYFTEGNIPGVETIRCDQITKDEFEERYVRRNREGRKKGRAMDDKNVSAHCTGRAWDSESQI